VELRKEEEEEEEERNVNEILEKKNRLNLT
jgi:hypothetical protein